MPQTATVVIEIFARDQTGKGLTSAQGGFRKLGASLGSLSKSFRPFSLAAGGIIAGATKAAIGFESAFAGVLKTTDGLVDEFGKLNVKGKELRQGFRDMAQEIPISANELAFIGELAGQLGVRADDILDFTETIAMLGVATDLSTEEASLSLARFMTIMGTTGDNIDELGSTIVDLGNNFAARESEIVAFAMRIAGAGAQIGLTEAQVLGFGTALASVGINAEAGGTAISRVFMDIANAVATGGEDLQRFADVAGMSTEAFAQSFEEDAANAVVTFIEGLGRLSDEGANVFPILDDLGFSNIRVKDALLRSAGAGDVLRKALGLAGDAWEENTALTEEAAKRFATTESQLILLKNKLVDMGISIGSIVIPFLLKFIDKIGGVIDWISNLSPKIIGLGVAFLGIVAAAAPVLAALSALVPVILALLSPVGLVIGIIAALGLAFATDFLGIRTKVAEVWDAVRPKLIALKDAILGIIGALTTQADTEAIDTITEALKSIGVDPELAGNIAGLAVQVRTSVSEIIDAFKAKGLSGAIAAFKEEWPKIKEAAQPILDDLVVSMKKAWDEIKEDVKTKWTEIRADIISKWDEIKVDAGTKWAEISEDIVSKWGEILSGIDKRFPKMRENIKKRWDEIKIDTGTKWDEIKDKIVVGWGNILAKIDELFPGLRPKIKEIWSGIVDETGIQWGKIPGKIKESLKVIWEAIEGIFTDPKKRQEFIDTVKTTLTSTLESAGAAISPVITELSSNITRWIKEAAGGGEETALSQDLATIINGVFESAAEEVKPATDSIASAVAAWVSSVADKLDPDGEGSTLRDDLQRVIKALIDDSADAVIVDYASSENNPLARVFDDLITNLVTWIEKDEGKTAESLGRALAKLVKLSIAVLIGGSELKEAVDSFGEGTAQSFAGSLSDPKNIATMVKAIKTWPGNMVAAFIEEMTGKPADDIKYAVGLTFLNALDIVTFGMVSRLLNWRKEWDALYESLRRAWNNFEGFLSGIDLKQTASNIWNSFTNGIKEAWQLLTGWLLGDIGGAGAKGARGAGIGGAFGSMISILASVDLLQIGKDTFTTLKNGMMNIWDTIITWLFGSGESSGVVGGLKVVLGSIDLLQIGKDIFTTLYSGMTNIWDNTIKPWLDGLVSIVQGIFDAIAAIVSAIFGERDAANAAAREAQQAWINAQRPGYDPGAVQPTYPSPGSTTIPSGILPPGGDIGDGIVTGQGGLMAALSPFSNAIGQVTTIIRQEIQLSVEDLLASLGKVVSAINAATGKGGELEKGLTDLSEEFMAGLSSAISTLIAVIRLREALAEWTEEVKFKIAPRVEALLSVLGFVAQAINQLAKEKSKYDWGTPLSEVAQNFVESIGPALSLVQSANSLRNALETWSDEVKGRIGPRIGVLVQVIGFVAQELNKIVKNEGGYDWGRPLSELAQKFAESFGSAVSLVMFAQGLREALEEWTDEVKNKIGPRISVLVQVVGFVAQELNKIVKNEGEFGWGEPLSELAQKFTESFGSAISLVESANGLRNALEEWTGEVVGKIGPRIGVLITVLGFVAQELNKIVKNEGDYDWGKPLSELAQKFAESFWSAVSLVESAHSLRNALEEWTDEVKDKIGPRVAVLVSVLGFVAQELNRIVKNKDAFDWGTPLSELAQQFVESLGPAVSLLEATNSFRNALEEWTDELRGKIQGRVAVLVAVLGMIARELNDQMNRGALPEITDAMKAFAERTQPLISALQNAIGFLGELASVSGPLENLQEKVYFVLFDMLEVMQIVTRELGSLNNELMKDEGGKLIDPVKDKLEQWAARIGSLASVIRNTIGVTKALADAAGPVADLKGKVYLSLFDMIEVLQIVRRELGDFSSELRETVDGGLIDDVAENLRRWADRIAPLAGIFSAGISALESLRKFEPGNLQFLTEFVDELVAVVEEMGAKLSGKVPAVFKEIGERLTALFGGIIVAIQGLVALRGFKSLLPVWVKRFVADLALVLEEIGNISIPQNVVDRVARIEAAIAPVLGIVQSLISIRGYKSLLPVWIERFVTDVEAVLSALGEVGGFKQGFMLGEAFAQGFLTALQGLLGNPLNQVNINPQLFGGAGANASINTTFYNYGTIQIQSDADTADALTGDLQMALRQG